MKITLKDLLEEETKVRYGANVITGDPEIVLCPKCEHLYTIGVLIVHEGKIKVWCRHCVEESN
jgi:hypothetical protein